MPNPLSPGVYIEEVSGGVKPIAGVGTSTAAFVGVAEDAKMPDKAVLITNWNQYVARFGGFIPNGYLPYAVYSFFAEGGSSCFVVGVKPTGATAASFKSIKDQNYTDALEITARSVGNWGNRVEVVVEDASGNKTANGQWIEEKRFKVIVKYKEADLFTAEYEGNGIIEVFDQLTFFDIEEKINGRSALIKVQVTLALPTDEPGILTFKNRLNNGVYQLSGGADNNEGGEGFKSSDFIGDASNKKGLHAFDEIDEINIVAIPDMAGNRDVILNGMNYCKNRKDCFFVADPPHGLTPTQVVQFKNAAGNYSGGNVFNSSYGALYYPWVYINDPATGKRKLVPPSGLVSGTFAYCDSVRGVHKAPAGITDGYLDTAVAIERIVTKGEHDLLNPEKINVIRLLPEGICIWGARTLAADAEWLYINVRRLMMYIEESIDEGTQWTVFEPNDPALWGKVKLNLTAFLTRVWRDGALFGSTPEEAFFVKVDEENNPPEVRDAGQLIVEVGVAPVKPAEFVIIQISQKTLQK
ncbi:MAG TPA: phage tail sheath C-terminal domain-containing protein [Bacillota bacterium]|nr:phage tail sheath C-terminal domain-containing protein [Bacillota bacterium]